MDASLPLRKENPAKAAPRRFVIPVLALAAAVMAAWQGTLSASDAYARNPAKGLAIYKASLAASDSTARITEFLGYRSEEAVTYLVAPNGARLTIPTRTSDLLLIPYPGRGELQPEAALMVISVADSRFPQYRPVLAPLKSAWIEESKRPRPEIAEEICKRQQNRSLAQKAGDLWNSITKPARKPAPSPTPKPAASTTPAPAGDENLTPKPADLQKNLRLIKDYYQALDKAAAGTNG